ncbi:MAG: toxin-antitoxin system YwqK family antitoxin [Candidatus Dojkabacteria bacterium]
MNGGNAVTENGITKTFYRNGTLATETEIDEKGEAHGTSKVFLKNGQMKAIGKMVHGKMDGEWKWWRESGEFWQEGHFINGSREGTWTRYARDGKVEKIKNFKYDKEVKKKK